MTLRLCKDCNNEKPLEAFSKQQKNKANFRISSNTDEYKPYCKACYARRAREWRKRNPAYRGSGKLTQYPAEDKALLSAIRSRVADCKERVKRKAIPLDIDADYMYQLYQQQQGLCAITGTKLTQVKGDFNALSIDQIESGQGYTKGNVQWVTWAVNRAKGDLDNETFIVMCQKVCENVQRLSERSTPK